jgi:hypothetical protein
MDVGAARLSRHPGWRRTLPRQALLPCLPRHWQWRRTSAAPHAVAPQAWSSISTSQTQGWSSISTSQTQGHIQITKFIYHKHKVIYHKYTLIFQIRTSYHA